MEVFPHFESNVCIDWNPEDTPESMYLLHTHVCRLLIFSISHDMQL